MGAKEAAIILDLVRDLKERGDVAIVIIAHNYAQALSVCDRVNVLQQGRITFDRASAETSVVELTELMTADYRNRRRRAADEGT
jgi:ABC-type sugar transport system ATPase subunit